MFRACFVSFGQLSPWADRMMATAASLRFSLTAAHGMIDRIHHHAAHVRPAPSPASAARLAAGNVHVVDVANLTNGREAVLMNPTNFARGQFHERITSFERSERRLLPGGARDLATAARSQFNVVHVRAQRNGPKRQRISQFRGNIISSINGCSDLKSVRRKNVA